ncbi:MAG: glycosyl hydrolase, partial [Bacteroidetes bacterium HGW-Bacteroidetes-13]
SVFDSAPTQNIGDIAVDWKNEIIWVGTGENNASRSSYAGIGILKSTDHGKTWENVGLPDSHHIGRIILNPNNPNEVVIGALGHLYSPNAERGVFKTKDGGKSWKKTLFVNENTGIIDVAFAPGNFQIQYAAAWQKDRKAWNFDGSGAGSGIYKSTDGGDSWTLLTTADSGFPTGKGVGRIGLAVFDENTVYAVHDNQFHRPETDTKPKTDALSKDDFKSISVEAFLNLDNKKLNDYLKNNGFQEKYRAENVKQLVRDGSVKPVDLAKYLEDANAQLFDTPVIGAEVYRTNDGGKTWRKTHEGYIDDLFYSYGYYFAQINVNPKDVNQIYLSGVPLIKSEDGGKTFKSIDKENVHSDHHALWIDPNLPGHLVNGNDGGVNITYDDGQNWLKANDPAVGQYYYINVDNQKPYNVYGGLQDNGVWKGANTYRASKSWQADGEYPYKEIMGGDGMQVQIDNRNANIVYTGFQFGNYYRLDLAKNDNKPITPQHDLGEAPYRFNWQTPILLSSLNQDILYFGSNHLHRSLDKGDTWESISPDLTQGGKPGNVAYGTLTSIAESPFQFGLIYIGTDDGNVQLTRNGGGSWENVSASFPKDLWVSRVVASAHKKERVYVSLNGYRWDDFKPYIYVSEDFGKTWKNINGNLPLSPVNVIKEDPKVPNLLYVGTDDGVYVSFNRGDSWELFSSGLPKVAV